MSDGGLLHVGMPGNIPLNDPKLIEIALWACEKIGSDLVGKRLELVRIISARTQVVSGVIYHLKLEMRPLEGRLYQTNKHFKQVFYEIQVLYQPWLNQLKLISAEKVNQT